MRTTTIPQLPLLDEAELARRSIIGFGELLAALGRASAGAAAELRRPDALDARIDALAGNPWFDAAVVTAETIPPADDPGLPTCLWTLADGAPGRVEEPGIALPCLGVALADPGLAPAGAGLAVEPVPLAVLGDVNERAYGDTGWFSPLVQRLRQEPVRTHGLRDEDGRFVCVALTLAVGDDLSIHYVATEASHRRRGLASSLLRAVMAAAREDGMRSATLQASAGGLPVWERLGFRRVATLRGCVRPDGGA